MKPKLGLSLSPTEDFHAATSSLFEAGSVSVVEWSFDLSWNNCEIPAWFSKIIDSFSEVGSVLGHGVTLSPLSARFSERQRRWLACAREEFASRNYLHASEHFGFSEAGPVAHGAPLAVPMNSESLRKGKEMMKRFADVAQCPVGLENLAFAFCMEDVKRQGEFIDKLISEVDGFLLLDLHNLYCQVENFRVPELELMKSYPLEKVRELHIAGGSWSHSPSSTRVAVRRDTHDGAVPQEVFTLASVALQLCSNVEFVLLERLGFTMMDSEAQQEFRDDFETMQEILDCMYE